MPPQFSLHSDDIVLENDVQYSQGSVGLCCTQWTPKSSHSYEWLIEQTIRWYDWYVLMFSYYFFTCKSFTSISSILALTVKIKFFHLMWIMCVASKLLISGAYESVCDLISIRCGKHAGDVNVKWGGSVSRFWMQQMHSVFINFGSLKLCERMEKLVSMQSLQRARTNRRWWTLYNMMPLTLYGCEWPTAER